jgi:hypothetical protein
MYFKANLEVTNWKKQKDERILFVQAKDIVQAMDITKKIKGSQIWRLAPISYKEYMGGVDLKYKN